MDVKIPSLEQIGLSGRDARVYQALLSGGVMSIRQVSDVTNINRGSAYESIKSLTSVGLISFQVKNKNKKYFAQSPEKILDIIKLRQEELTELEQKTEQLIPKLNAASAYLPYENIKFYEDLDGVANVLRDLIETVSGLENKEYYAISSKPMRQYLYDRFPGFTRTRIKHKISVKVIAIGEGGEDAKYAQRKWMQPESGSEPSTYNLIYGTKFAMISLSKNMHPYAVVIDDPGVYAMQKLWFDQVWQSL